MLLVASVNIETQYPHQSVATRVRDCFIEINRCRPINKQIHAASFVRSERKHA